MSFDMNKVRQLHQESISLRDQAENLNDIANAADESDTSYALQDAANRFDSMAKDRVDEILSHVKDHLVDKNINVQEMNATRNNYKTAIRSKSDYRNENAAGLVSGGALGGLTIGGGIGAVVGASRLGNVAKGLIPGVIIGTGLGTVAGGAAAIINSLSRRSDANAMYDPHINAAKASYGEYLNKLTPHPDDQRLLDGYIRRIR